MHPFCLSLGLHLNVCLQAGVDDFPTCVHLVSLEKEQLSSEALEGNVFGCCHNWFVGLMGEWMLQLLVLPATVTLERLLERTPSICASVSTHGMCFASTRCCHALALIGTIVVTAHPCIAPDTCACSLQTGMRGAFGKPQGTVARVNIGQILLSIRCKDSVKHHIVEALRRAK